MMRPWLFFGTGKVARRCGLQISLREQAIALASLVPFKNVRAKFDIGAVSKDSRTHFAACGGEEIPAKTI